MKLINGNGQIVNIATTGNLIFPASLADRLAAITASITRGRLETRGSEPKIFAEPLTILLEESELTEFFASYEKHYWVRPQPLTSDDPSNPVRFNPEIVDFMPVLQGIADGITQNCSSGSFIARKMAVGERQGSDQKPYSSKLVWGWQYVPTPSDIIFNGDKQILLFHV